MKQLVVPDSEAWKGYEDDLDLIDMYQLFNEKCISDIYYYFKDGASVSRSDELLHSNRQVFQYYIYAFMLYLLSVLGQNDDEAKEVFLFLLLSREKKDQGSVSQIFNKKVNIHYIDDEFINHEFHLSLHDVIEMIKKQYEEQIIDNWLYDDFPDTFEQIKVLLN